MNLLLIEKLWMKLHIFYLLRYKYFWEVSLNLYELLISQKIFLQ